MAVFTSGELAMERASNAAASIGGRAGDQDGDELARAFAIARDAAGQIFGDLR